MSDEQYERLFRIALRPRRYRYNHDDDLVGRNFVRVERRGKGINPRTLITLEGLRRLETRLKEVLA